MRHSAPGELLELHFGELPAERRDAASAHVQECVACRALLADVAWAEGVLLAGPEEGPPADGLRRVLARIEAVRPARDPAGWPVRPRALPGPVTHDEPGRPLSRYARPASVSLTAIEAIIAALFLFVLILFSRSGGMENF